jgi:hypothetical protein
MKQARPKAGLILTGGGARAAYQVGMLKAIRELLPDQAKKPFPILCGTSALPFLSRGEAQPPNTSATVRSARSRPSVRRCTWAPSACW